MKPSNCLIYFLIPLLLVGCSLHELTVDGQGQRLAPTLGVDKQDIQFISYSDFGIISNPFYETYRARKGVIIVANSDLFFMIRHKQYLFSKDVQRIPIASIDGIALLDSQIQLNQDNRVLVILLDKASTKERTQEKYKQLYQSLLEAGVSTFASTTHYEKTGYIQSPRRSSGSSNWSRLSNNSWEPPLPGN